MKTGKLIVFCGPSGTGKATIERGFLNDEQYQLVFSISTTTRAKRENEVDGENYHFVDVKKFKKLIKDGYFLEWAKFSGNYYGTSKQQVEAVLKTGKNMFLEIEIIGVKNIIKLYPNALTIFLAPPSIEELKLRLKNRNTENWWSINRRIYRAKIELKNQKIFKYIVVNKNADEAIKQIRTILTKELYE